jgi:cytochrome oxidase Cu insertion factor (SCO1/SenC/PrrC family)
MSGDVLALVAIALVVGTGVVWFRLMNEVRIPQRRSAFFVAMGLGAAAAAVGLVQGTSLLGGVAAWIAIALATIFIGLRAQSAQAPKTPAVTVGGPILDFVAEDAAGEPFDLASLRGRPYLLKFFRGHW